MDRDTFFRHLQRSGLLSQQGLEEAVRACDSPRAKVFARTLVERGLLTRFQAGRLLAGRLARLCLGQYRLLERLGRGAMGRVYKAVHATTGRVVAIKVILAGVFEDASAVGLFNREVRVAARLHHPHIVTAHDADEVRGTRFLVMEYVDGPSLQALVRARGPLPIELACELLRQSADALQYAYEQGMVHRDIRPANLLLAQPKQPARVPVVKLVDFGIARVPAAGWADTIPAEPGAVFGTVDYISPEQAQDVHAVDIRSDLYSLGCTFFYALTGRVPFPGDNPMEKLLKQLMSEPQPLRELRPDVPPEVESIVLRLLAKDPAHRFQTPAELARALDALPGERASARKWRLLACAYLRQVWHLLADPVSQRAVRATERRADGELGGEELKDAQRAATAAMGGGPGPRTPAARAAAYAVGNPDSSLPSAVSAAAEAAAWAGEVLPESDLRRDVFGPLVCPVGPDPAWRTADVLALAQAAYEERTLPGGHLEPVRLTLLADALEDAGCSDSDVLGHLRDPGPHVRGCWVVDLLLGKS